MTCFSPLPAFFGNLNSNTNKHKVIVVSRSKSNLKKYSMRVPCNQCVGCRLDYSRQWAIRCMHEASLHEDNSFITLTYNDKFLPKNASLNYEHWTKFMKRLRKRFPEIKIRFYMGPEYGEKSGRPHYHAILFGIDFADKKLFSIRNEHRLYVSQTLNELWSCPKTGQSYGFASVGSVTFQSAAYVARYMMKKVKGEDINMRYFTDVDLETGEICKKEPEKARMSLKPGIAKEWFDKYNEDVYHEDSDYVIMNNKKVRPPRYYDKLLESVRIEDYYAIKEQRVLDAKKYEFNNTEERLSVRLKVKLAQLVKLVRNID